MRIVYEANSALEGHMIVNLLLSYDIEAQIFGEHLQGGVGEIHGLGFVRVSVADHYYDEAMKHIAEYEASQREDHLESKNSNKHQQAASKGPVKIIIGFIIGLALSWIVLDLDIS